MYFKKDKKDKKKTPRRNVDIKRQYVFVMAI